MSEWWVFPVMGAVGVFAGWELQQAIRTGQSSFQMIGGRRGTEPVGYWTAVLIYGFLLLTSLTVIGAWLFDPNFHL